MIKFACLSPHPPILLPNVGSSLDKEKLSGTIEALKTLRKKIEKVSPQIIIISSPHPEWGLEVPLYFLKPNQDYLERPTQEANKVNLEINQKENLIYPILTTLDSPQEHFDWGKQLSQQLPDGETIALIASGDMSHRLKKEGPYGFHPNGPEFDRQLINLLKQGKTRAILDLDKNLAENAGECGWRSLCLVLGVIEGQKIKLDPQIFSYQKPFGVGYLVASLI